MSKKIKCTENDTEIKKIIEKNRELIEAMKNLCLKLNSNYQTSTKQIIKI